MSKEKIISTLLQEKKKNPHEGHRARLREKFSKDSTMETFADHELLEFHLSLVIPRKDTNALAHELIDKFGSLNNVLLASPNELIKVKNMTVAAAYLLASESAVVRRGMRSDVLQDKNDKLVRPRDTISLMQIDFLGRKVECFSIALLDLNYRLMRTFFTEGYSGTYVPTDVADIMLKISREGAKYVIIAHNHPSGNVTPSLDDIDLTRNIYGALNQLNVELLDHIIFHDFDAFSFRNNGILQTIEKDLFLEENKSISDDSELRRQFLTDLNEYILEPTLVPDGRLVAKPRNVILAEYEKKLKREQEKKKNDKKSPIYDDDCYFTE